jgi:CBS domain-containing protein
MSMTVRDVMSTQVVCVKEDAAFAAMAAVPRQHRVSAFPVLDEKGRVIGVVSEADMLAKEALGGGEDGMPGMITGVLRHKEQTKARGVTAGEIMSAPPITVLPEATVEQAARLMYLHRVKRLPVTDADHRCSCTAWWSGRSAWPGWACCWPPRGAPPAGAATPAAACGSPARRRPMSAGIATTSSTSGRPPAHTRQAPPRTTARPAPIPVRAQTTAAEAGCTCSGGGQLPRTQSPKLRNRRMARSSRMSPPIPRPRSSTLANGSSH